jgi:hypothetical protein
MTADKSPLFVLFVLLLVGCGPDPTMAQPDDGPLVAESARFRIERVDVFRDGLAYNDRRGIYVIRDKQTGREFIGVSGIGITEQSAHTQSCGKSCVTTREDER